MLSECHRERELPGIGRSSATYLVVGDPKNAPFARWIAIPTGHHPGPAVTSLPENGDVRVAVPEEALIQGFL